MAGEKENTSELDKYINDLADIKEDEPVKDVDDTGEGGAGSADGDDHADEANQQTVDANQQDANAGAQDQNADPDASKQKQKDGGKKSQQSGKSKKDTGQDQLRPLGDGTYANAKGDIVDQSGKLIAQNGFAARMYHTNTRLKATLEERTRQLNELSRAVGEVQSLATSIRNYGLTNDETAQALDMAGRLKRGDVLGVAKDVLAMIAARGYNVTDLLGGEVGDTLDMRAVSRMLDERLAPITREEQARQRELEAARRGKAEYDRFIASNDYAEIHANDIVAVMRKEGVNPQTAYNRLLQFATLNRLDFSKPLGPQVKARLEQLQQQRQQQQNGNGQGNRQQKPMPNGASTRAPGAVPTLPLASADDDWGTIISEVQRTIGNA